MAPHRTSATAAPRRFLTTHHTRTLRLLNHIKRKHKNSEAACALRKSATERERVSAAAKRAIEATVDDPKLLEAAVKEVKNSHTLQREIRAFTTSAAATAPPGALPYGDTSQQQQRHDLLVMVDIACGFKSFAVRPCVRALLALFAPHILIRLER